MWSVWHSQGWGQKAQGQGARDHDHLDGHSPQQSPAPQPGHTTQEVLIACTMMDRGQDVCPKRTR